MVQETDQIKNHIDRQRGKLERDLREIEDRVTRAVDWREQFNRNPLAIIGTAAAGGFVLSLLLRRSSDVSKIKRSADIDPAPTNRYQPKSMSKTSSHLNRMADTLDDTVAALLGVASRKIRDFVADAVPNFREEYREVETSRASSRNNSGPKDPRQVSGD